MNFDFHLLRPWWLLSFIPLIVLFVFHLRQQKQVRSCTAWRQSCDAHLLPYVLIDKQPHATNKALILLYGSIFFVCISLCGPSWVKLPVPTYRIVEPRVLILDMSDAMAETDLSPNRLTRAKFLLRDLFAQHYPGQLGLIAFTEEPFTVSPLTEDANTIAALLPTLNPDVMPVGGYNLTKALEEGTSLITQAGFTRGQLLVLSATPPDETANKMAHNLAVKGITTSILPMTNEGNLARFEQFAKKGKGQVLSFSDKADDLTKWMSSHQSTKLIRNEQNNLPIWRDEGRWFLIPALLLLLPLFRRGMAARVVL